MEPFFPVDFKLCAAGLTVGAGDTPAPTDLRPSRLTEIMRLQAENASLRAAYAELEARYAALHALHAANPVVLVDAATGFPAHALRHSV